MPDLPEPTQIMGDGGWVPLSVKRLQEVLPQYEVIEMLGRGGMGAVYKARQRSLKRLVAIKILPPDAATDEMRFSERFLNEAQTMAAMNHSAIVSVYDFGETADGLLYLVMEFVDGTDVHKMIQTNGRLSGDYALAITAHVCDALHYAHSRGVIHRDIKPANILINQEGHVKVADFGLAKMNDLELTSGLTLSNVAMGTPDYIAPEALRSTATADHRADLYAVGVMLYQMLTGEVPRGMFKLPSQKGIGADPRFDEIICKAMEPNRDERYQSAVEVRAALQEIITAPVATGAGALAVRGVLSPVPVAMELQAPLPVPRPARGNRVAAAVIGVLLVAGIAGISLALRDKGQGKTSPLSTASDFAAEVAKAPPLRQVDLVGERIYKLNKARVRLVPKIEEERVVDLKVDPVNDGQVSDLSPIAALRELEAIQLAGAGRRSLEWMRGMKVDKLSIMGGSVTDLAPLRSLPLRYLTVKAKVEGGFAVLAGMQLRSLIIAGNSIGDISFVREMPLNFLSLQGCNVTDWSPIREMPMEMVAGDFVPERDAEILRAVRALKLINGRPAAEFLAGIQSPSSPAVTVGKTTDTGPAFIGSVAKANGPQQVNLVRAKLKELNGAEVEIEPTIVTGKVLGAVLKKAGGGVTDISALAALQNLQTLDVASIQPRDLACLADLPLVELICGKDFKPDAALLRGIQTLKLINGRPAAEFLAGTGAPDSPTAPPKITTWRDVTAEAREKAKATPRLTADDQGIRKDGKGEHPRLLLTPPGRGDVAVRVHYTGEAQVDLRYGEAGFIYVLAQVNQTIIQSWAPGGPSPVTLIPNKLHPAGFDPAQPHELLVTLEGVRLRVWLDGRFVAEAKADAFTEGETALLFVPKTVVQKVELADLAK